ncbi:hypothetical protein DV735_g4479, partial [Chaetothyriales sp. CBS 134920]
MENSSPRPSPFHRPDPLKIAAAASNDFERQQWHSQRSIWHAPRSSLSSRASDDLTPRSDSLRQKSASSIHFPRPTDGPGLPPVENHQRTASKAIPNPWPFSAATPADSRPRQRLNSPTRPQTNSGWHFPHDLNISSEGAFLLRNSDPDVDPANEPKTRNGFPFDALALQGGNPAPAVRKMHGSAANDKTAFSSAVSIVNNASSSINSIDSSESAMPTSGKKMLLSDSSPAAQRFGSTAVSSRGGRLASPTRLKYSNSQVSANQRMPFSIDPTAESFKNLAVSGHVSRVQASRGSSVPFPGPEAANGHVNVSSHVALIGTLPQSRLTADPTEFRPAGLMDFIDGPDAGTVLSFYPTTWVPNAPETPQPTDFRNGGNGQYYSSGATPSTGRDSGPSATGSGVSSRSSSIRDFTIVDRKLGNLDTFQQPHTFYSAGVPAFTHPPYEFAPNPNVRMNPLAGAYAPFGVAAFSISAVAPYGMAGRMGGHEQDSLVGRSLVLEDFRLHHKTSKRYELRDIFNHVVEFSGDQHGSRFIQQKLETANSDEKEQVFKEVQTNCLQLMTDVFGNYVIQKLFEHGNQAQKKSLANQMKGHVLTLSTQVYGCRVVQKALEHVLTDQQASLVRELDGPNKQILKVIRDQNGNHVVQKAIERVPAEHVRFIIEAHRGEAVKLATHTYGCRVIQRILEYCGAADRQILLDELYTCIPPLITDAFGNYVVQHIIEKGDPEGRRRAVSFVLQQVLTFSKHKFASNVVEKCIDHADPDQRAEIFRRLVGPNEQGQTPVLGLLRDQFGNYVIQKVHSWLRGPDLDALVNEMKLYLPQLKRNSYGKQVVAIEKLLYGIPDTPTHASGDPGLLPQIPAGNYVTGAGLATDHQAAAHRRGQQPGMLPALGTFHPE